MAFEPFNAIPQSQSAYAPFINAAAAQRGVNPLYLSAIIQAESSGNPNAVGPMTRGGRQARGLMQFMPDTWNEVAGRYGIKGDVTDPEANIQGGAAYYAQLRDQFGNDQDALMAYNWGPGNVDKWIKGGRDPNKVPTETQNYVKKITGYAPSSLYPSEQAAAVQPVGREEWQGPAKLPPIPPGPEITGIPPAVPLQDDPSVQTASGDMLGQQPADLLNPGAVAADEPGFIDKLTSKPGAQAMMDAGAAMLAASGWSNRPVTLGQAMGAGMQAGSAGYQGAQDRELNERMVNAKIAELEQKNTSLAAMRQQLGLGGGGSGVPTGTTAATGGGVTTASGTKATTPGAAAAARPEDGTFASTLNAQEAETMALADSTGDPDTIMKARQDIIAARAKTASDAAAAGAEGADKRQDRINYMADDYAQDKAVQLYQLAAPTYNQLQETIKGGKFDAVDDNALILWWYKTYDPTSTVTGGEHATAADTAAYFDKAVQAFKRQTGLDPGRLDPNSRKAMADQITSRVQEYRKGYDTATEYWGKRADDAGIDRGLIIQPGYDMAEPVALGGGSQGGTVTPASRATVPPPPTTVGTDQVKATPTQIQNLPINGTFYAPDANGQMKLWRKVSETDAEEVE